MTQRLKDFVKAFEREWAKRFAPSRKGAKSESPSSKEVSPPLENKLDAAKAKREAVR